MLRSHSHALPGAHAGSIGRQRSRGGGTASAHMRARQRAPPRSVTAAPPPWRPKTGWRGACVEVSGRRGCGRSGSCSRLGVDWRPRFDAASSFRTALPDPCRTAQTALVLALRYIYIIFWAPVSDPRSSLPCNKCRLQTRIRYESSYRRYAVIILLLGFRLDSSLDCDMKSDTKGSKEREKRT